MSVPVWNSSSIVDTLGHYNIGPSVVFESFELHILPVRPVRPSRRAHPVVAVVVVRPSVTSSVSLSAVLALPSVVVFRRFTSV